MEKTIKQKTCTQCSDSFDITDGDIEFYEKVSPSFGGKKYQIPTPTLCADCRQQRRLSFRNERNLYKRICDATGTPIVSIYSPEKPYVVYSMDMWLSDKWDGLEYARDIDFSKSMLSQFKVLLQETPRIPSFQFHNENSVYSNGSQRNKNCYMIFVSDYNEDCTYTNGTYYSQDCIDTLGVNKSTNCYECIDNDNCNNCFYSQDLVNCNRVLFSKDCHNCNDCYFCEGLRDKRYCINNTEYTKEEYHEKIENNDYTKTNNYSSPNLYYHGFGINNSTGDFIKNIDNSINCFESQELKDCKHISYGINIKDCHDGYVVVDNSENCYEITSCISNYNSLFVYCSWNNNTSYYIDTCQDSSDLFLCVGLRNKQYCILNKQYTKEEYETLVPKIIEHMKKHGEWGEFFPSSLSPFGYNETVANEYFPLTREEVLCHSELDPESFEGNNVGTQKDPKTSSGGQLLHGPIFNWSDYEAPFPKVEKVILASKLPENISEIPDDILNWAIECEVTKKPFRIIKPELEFYRKHNLPIPKRHPDQRHLDRMNLRNPRKLYERSCDKCSQEIHTTYSPERKEIVYCEECYNKEIY